MRPPDRAEQHPREEPLGLGLTLVQEERVGNPLLVAGRPFAAHDLTPRDDGCYEPVSIEEVEVGGVPARRPDGAEGQYVSLGGPGVECRAKDMEVRRVQLGLGDALGFGSVATREGAKA